MQPPCCGLTPHNHALPHAFIVSSYAPGCYKFSRYKTGKLDANNSNNSSSNAGKQGAQQAASSSEDAKPLLVVPKGADVDSVLAMAEAFYWVSAPAAGWVVHSAYMRRRSGRGKANGTAAAAATMPRPLPLAASRQTLLGPLPACARLSCRRVT